jgi:hypothetical protein
LVTYEESFWSKAFKHVYSKILSLRWHWLLCCPMVLRLTLFPKDNIILCNLFRRKSEYLKCHIFWKDSIVIVSGKYLFVHFCSCWNWYNSEMDIHLPINNRINTLVYIQVNWKGTTYIKKCKYPSTTWRNECIKIVWSWKTRKYNLQTNLWYWSEGSNIVYEDSWDACTRTT